MSVYSSFDRLKSQYDNNRFGDLMNEEDGIYWLKLKSIDRKSHLVAVCQKIGIDCSGVNYRKLLRLVYDRRPPIQVVDDYISTTYESERVIRRSNEDSLVSQLYEMKVFDWGGSFNNNLEQNIVDNYIKKIQDWDELNTAIDNELHFSMQGYVQCSWYNHWSSILIEDIFKDHANVLPTIGLAKKVDFFIHDFPFDLKVTHFPYEFMGELRKQKNLKPEFTVLKKFCRDHGIWYDRNKKPKQLFLEILTKLQESPSSVVREFLEEFNETRSELIMDTLDDPAQLLIWLYEKQGDRRFDAANRFFLVLINLENLEDSWKLKWNKPLLSPIIHEHLDQYGSISMKDLKLRFTWKDSEYETYADILPIVV